MEELYIQGYWVNIFSLFWRHKGDHYNNNYNSLSVMSECVILLIIFIIIFVEAGDIDQMCTAKYLNVAL